MKCVICHGEDIKRMEVKEKSILGNDVIYIPVNVLVCQSCGERYYDRRTMQFLEGIEKKIKKTTVKLKEIGKVLIYDEVSCIA